MKKTLLFSMAAAAMLANGAMAATVEERVAKLEEALAKQKEINSELNARTAGNHLKFGVDYRFSVDNIQYTMADGSKYGNADLYRSRLWIDMGYKYNENLSFTGQLAYNTTFGNRFAYTPNTANFETFDWVSSEIANDDQIRVRQAYFFIKDDNLFGADIPWTFSIGRRPSTNGYLANLREDDKAASPMGHVINVEFDGSSAKFGLEGLTSIPGAYIKACYGRGATNANIGLGTATPYATQNMGPAGLGDIDFGGVIFVPYDDGQYSVHSLYSYANDMIDGTLAPVDSNGDGTADTWGINGVQTVGDMHLATVNVKANGIGDGISDFLDDTVVFASYAWSKSLPQEGNTMFGSTEDKLGNSVWAGVLFPSFLTDGGKWGIEYNQGSKYWKPVTQGEDTAIGSKLATRGTAFEVYMTENLIDDALTFQLRYTMIDNEYTGSQGFYGSNTATPQEISNGTWMPNPADGGVTMVSADGGTVDKATDLRAYLRYRF